MSYKSAITTKIRNPRLRLLNALQAKAKPIMTFLGLPSFRTAQVVAQTGVDVRASKFADTAQSSTNTMANRESSLIANMAISMTMQCTVQQPLYPAWVSHRWSGYACHTLI